MAEIRRAEHLAREFNECKPLSVETIRLFINGSLSHVISLQRLPHNTLRRYRVVDSYKTSKLKCKGVSLSIGPLTLPRSFFHRDVAIILLRLIQVQLMSFVTMQYVCV